MKKVLLLFMPALLFPILSWGQVQSVLPVSTAKNGILTATAYDWEAIGVNPANLGWSNNHIFSFTLLDIGTSGQSGGMRFSTFMTALNAPGIITRSDSWQKILGTPAGLNANADVNWIAASFRVPTLPGTFALNMRDRVIANGFLGTSGSLALSNSDTHVYSPSAIMSLLNGTTLQYMHYREINLAYGTPLFNVGGGRAVEDPITAKCFSFGKNDYYGSDEVALYGGIGLKYLIGLAYINGDVTGGGINATYAMTHNYPNIGPGFPNAPGHGFAADLGLGATYKRWTFSLSATDIGSITWKHSLATVHDTNVAPINYGSDFINELKTGTLTGSQPTQDVTTALPSKLRIGAAYKYNRKITLSSDVILPLNNAYSNISGPYVALGGQANVYKSITLFTGLATVHGYGIGMPIGISFAASRHISFYAGTTDITSYAGKRRNDNISAAVWLFRYNL